MDRKTADGWMENKQSNDNVYLVYQDAIHMKKTEIMSGERERLWGPPGGFQFFSLPDKLSW